MINHKKLSLCMFATALFIITKLSGQIFFGSIYYGSSATTFKPIFGQPDGGSSDMETPPGQSGGEESVIGSECYSLLGNCNSKLFGEMQVVWRNILMIIQGQSAIIRAETDLLPPKQKGVDPATGVVKNPNGHGWIDKWVNIWKQDRSRHGGFHWDVTHPNGSNTNVLPDGRVRPGSIDNFPNICR